MPAESTVMRVLAHPLRIKIMQTIGSLGGVASPVQLADALTEPLGNISYHVRALQAAGLIRLAGTRQRRGAVEHRYRVDRTIASEAARELHRAAYALERTVAITPPPQRKEGSRARRPARARAHA